jgi:hypothetical protein
MTFVTFVTFMTFPRDGKSRKSPTPMRTKCGRNADEMRTLELSWGFGGNVTNVTNVTNVI